MTACLHRCGIDGAQGLYLGASPVLGSFLPSVLIEPAQVADRT